MPTTLPTTAISPGFSLVCARHSALIALAVAVYTLLGCASTTALAARELAQRRICLANGETTRALVVEVAKSPSEKKRGLQHRRHLAPGSGMLFVYERDQPAESAFWMYLTPTPLAIAFIDTDGIIQTIRQMEPCTEATADKCPVYPAGKPFRYALEVNWDYFQRHRIAPGDRVVLDDAGNCD
jgi:uncharacterized protein